MQGFSGKLAPAGAIMTRRLSQTALPAPVTPAPAWVTPRWATLEGLTPADTRRIMQFHEDCQKLTASGVSMKALRDLLDVAGEDLSDPLRGAIMATSADATAGDRQALKDAFVALQFVQVLDGMPRYMDLFQDRPVDQSPSFKPESRQRFASESVKTFDLVLALDANRGVAAASLLHPALRAEFGMALSPAQGRQADAMADVRGGFMTVDHYLAARAVTSSRTRFFLANTASNLLRLFEPGNPVVPLLAAVTDAYSHAVATIGSEPELCSTCDVFKGLVLTTPFMRQTVAELSTARAPAPGDSGAAPVGGRQLLSFHMSGSSEPSMSYAGRDQGAVRYADELLVTHARVAELGFCHDAHTIGMGEGQHEVAVLAGQMLQWQVGSTKVLDLPIAVTRYSAEVVPHPEGGAFAPVYTQLPELPGGASGGLGGRLVAPGSLA